MLFRAIEILTQIGKRGYCDTRPFCGGYVIPQTPLKIEELIGVSGDVTWRSTGANLRPESSGKVASQAQTNFHQINKCVEFVCWRALRPLFMVHALNWTR